MGENVKVVEQRSPADELREQIRHTEGDITETVQTLEYRLSPGFLGRQGVIKARMAAWQGTAKLFELAQRRTLAVSVVGAGAILMLLGAKKAQHKVKKRTLTEREATGNALKALGTSALWMVMRRKLAGKAGHREKAAVSGVSLAAAAAKAFLTGARHPEKRPDRRGKKEAWRGLASTLGALGGYWYSHRGHRV